MADLFFIRYGLTGDNAGRRSRGQRDVPRERAMPAGARLHTLEL